MEYDRVRIKLAAKAAVRRGSPRPWLVTLVYLLLTQALVSAVSMAVTLPATLAAGANLAIRGHGGHISRGAASAASGLFLAVMVFLYLLAMLFTLVMQTGYLHYTMRLWRGRRTEIKDLFFGFHLAGRIICLSLLLFLLSFLWTVVSLAVLVPFSLLAVWLDSQLLALLLLPATVLSMALLYNRLLRYALSYYLLLDHPDWRALDCIHESKRLMAGRRWSLLLLSLSFLGWTLLVAAIILAVYLLGGFAIFFFFQVSRGGFAALPVRVFGMFLPLLLAAAALLCSAPLLLWLTAYMGTAFAGFYDCAAGTSPAPVDESAPPAPVGTYCRVGGPDEASVPHYYYSGTPAGEPPRRVPGSPPSPHEPELPPGFYTGFLHKDPPEDGAP